MSVCGERSLVDRGVMAFRAITLKCRSWGCETCRTERQRQLIALAMSGHATTFITLSVNPAVGLSPEHRARLLVEAWRQVVKLACKRWGIGHIPYLCVFEATKKGEPHLHILARVKYIPQAWLSETMNDLIEAPVVDIRAVKSQGAAAYEVAKYVGKDPHRFATCKRYWSTRSWEVNGAERGPDDPIWQDRWYVVNRTLAGLRRLWTSLGYNTVMEDGMLVAMATGPPRDPGEASGTV